ncbi:MAG: DNA mismatch repair endonuclease MutL [Proteobacteria bacterium]|nr:DNA mismatch repair endonuclease MutL [Pseudomonadota bacterium]
MQSRIKVLPSNTISQIAAGEVIDRPSSCVKELLENSVDAGATKIDIEIKSAGKLLIKVKDNGMGMNKEDIINSVNRHATSKINAIEDLENIKSYGFRGEALASIASVSKLSIISRTSDEQVGTRIFFDKGKVVNVDEVACEVGTTVHVERLFYNLPVRFKFLKSDISEYRAILQEIFHSALPNPRIEYNVKSDNRNVIRLSSTDNIKERIFQIIDNSYESKFIPVSYDDEKYHIKGFITKPEININSNNYREVFINGRYVSNKTVAKAIISGYGETYTKSRPGYYLFIELPQNEIDVNIHPKKLEVKFQDEKHIFSLIYHSIQEVIHSGKGVISVKDKMNIEKPSYKYNESSDRSNSISLFSDTEEYKAEQQKSFAFDDRINKSQFWQFHDTYILTETQTALLIIDQHAAHERIIYEQLQEEGLSKSQKLLFPIVINLATDKIAFIDSIIDDLESLKFEISKFSGNTLIINAIPSILKKITKDIFMEIIEGVKGEKGTNKFI